LPGRRKPTTRLANGERDDERAVRRRLLHQARNARALACVGNRSPSPKVRHYPRQRSQGCLSLSITTVLSRLAVVVEAPVRLHHHGPGARAVAEGEARSALILDALNYRFFTKWVAPDLRLIDIPEGAAADLGNEPVTSCPIMLWVVGIPEWDLGDLLVKLGLSRSSLEVVEYHEAFVILRKQP